MSLDLLIGYGGMASLGHAAYFGVAAYATRARRGAAALGASGSPSRRCSLAAALTAVLFALLALRTRGSYFLMITLALSQVVWGVAFGWRSLTGGDDGLPEVPRPNLGLPWPLDRQHSILLLRAVLRRARRAAAGPHRQLAVRSCAPRHSRERNPDAGARLQRLALQAHGVRAGRHLRRPGRLPLCLLQPLRQPRLRRTSPAPPRCC